MTTPRVLVGRSAAFAALDHARGRAERGHAQVVLVEGEPGMGKSALLEAFVAESGLAETVRWLRCDPFERQVALAAAGRLLEDDDLVGGSTVGVGRRLLACLDDLGHRADPVAVLAVDDVQWMDRPSADALRFAVRRLRADRILCLVARRPGPGGVDVWTEAPGDTTVVRLGPLDAEAVASLARRTRHLDPPPALAERVVRRTGGLPLLVAAVVRDAGTVADLDPAGPVPASAATAVARMLSSVDAPARRLVEAAAVVGTTTDLTVLAGVAGVADPQEALAAAAAAGLVVSGRSGATRCAHALLADAVIRTLTPDRLRDLHRRSAEWSTGDRRLVHLAAASDRPDPGLAAVLRSAADTAHAAQRYDLAADHRLRARSVSDRPDERERLLLDALVERVDAQDLVGAEELAPLASEAAPQPRRSLALGLLAVEEGEVGAARTLLRDALETADVDVDRATAARAALAAATLEVRVGDGMAAVELLRDAPRGDDENVADALTTLGMALWQAGEVDEALALLDVARPELDGKPWHADLLGARGMISMYAGRPQRALVDLDAAIDLVDVWRPSAYQSRRFVLRSATRFLLGDWDGAAADAAAGRALAEGPAERWSSSVAFATSVDVPACRGEFDVAEEYLQEAVRRAPQVPNVLDLVGRHHVVLAAAQGDHARVLDVLDRTWTEEYLERAARARTLPVVVRARISACLAVGRLAEAEEDLGRYQALLDRWPGPGMVPAGLGWLRGRLAEAHGDPATARRLYASDLADPDLSAYPLQRAELLHESGRLEVALGNRDDAVDRLTEARAGFAALHATPYLRRCGNDLLACGLPASASQPSVLTPREADVRALVVRGLSNKQVAEELFLTVKTVEYHLRNVYMKLGVQGRHDLRDHEGPATAAPADRAVRT